MSSWRTSRCICGCDGQGLDHSCRLDRRTSTRLADHRGRLRLEQVEAQLIVRDERGAQVTDLRPFGRERLRRAPQAIDDGAQLAGARAREIALDQVARHCASEATAGRTPPKQGISPYFAPAPAAGAIASTTAPSADAAG